MKLKTGENVLYKSLKEQYDTYEDDLYIEINFLQNKPVILNDILVQTIHE